MSELAATQIPKPSDEQAFERANEVLWRCELNDPHVKTYGRRGQAQYGVDLTGFRDGNVSQIVGVQAKLKGQGKYLADSEIRKEVAKALTFKPLLREYVIVTTADDSNDLDTLALELSQQVSEGRGIPLRIQIYGWGSLERKIQRHPDAINAFDPSHTPQSDQLSSQVMDVGTSVTEFRSAAEKNNTQIVHKLDQIQTFKVTSDSDEKLLSAIERQIDHYAETIQTNPNTALTLLRKLSAGLEHEVSGRVRFRIEANIAACHFNLDDKVVAAKGFIEAFDHDPSNPKAAAKKAFGLLLKQDFQQLRMFGNESLARSPGNEELGEYFVLGCIDDRTIEDPTSLLPSQVAQTSSVLRALIRWEIERSPPERWWATAHDAYAKFPDDEIIAEYHANALTDEVLRKVHARHDRAINDAEVAMINQAIDIYQQVWRKILRIAPPRRQDMATTALNLAQALHIVRRDQDCKNLLDHALNSFPGSISLREMAVLFYLESGAHDRADKLLKALPPSSATISWRHAKALACANWPLVLKLIDQHVDLLPEEDREVIIASGKVATIQLLPEPTRRDAIIGFGESFSDPRSYVLLAQCARLNNVPEKAKQWLSESAFLTAGLATSANQAQRITVSQEAIYQGEPAIAAKLLWGYVDLSHHNHELELLGRAVAFEVPVRARGAEFFDRLPTDIRNQPIFQFLEGHLYLSSGFPKKAITVLEQAFRRLKEINALVALAVAHLRNNDKASVRTLIEDVGLDDFNGLPLAKLEYCQILREFDQSDRALNLAYATLMKAHQDPSVIKKFCAIVLTPQDRASEEPIHVVGPGVWVSMSSSAGAKLEGIIGEKASQPWANHLSSDSPIVVACIGLHIDEGFDFQPLHGNLERWTVNSIKPKWLQAFHYLAETYSYLFPADSSFTKIDVQDGDIEPVIDMVRAHGLANKAIADQYDHNHLLPLALIAGNHVSGSVGFAEYLVELGKPVRTCEGTLHERDGSSQLIRNHGRAGAVLDLLTAWRAAEMNVLPELKSTLGELILPTSELDPIKETVSAQERHLDQDYLSLSYINGHLFKTERTVIQQRRNIEILQRRIAHIEQNCTIEPVTIPNQLPDFVEELISTPSGHIFAPAIRAQEGLLLLSDDMAMRKIANLFDVDSVWLQVSLLNAKQGGILSARKYTESVMCLIARRHEFVSVSSADLFFCYQRDDDEDLDGVRLLCEAVGVKNAGLLSHVRLVAEFLNLIWRTASPSGNRHYKASDIALTALLATNRAGGEVLQWAATLMWRLDVGPGRYVHDWLRGHFLHR